MYKHLFFDLDGTVTRSRSLIAPEMKEMLTSLMERGIDIIIVSGALVEQSKKQMDNFKCFYLGQNGNHALNNKTGEELWFNVLSETQKEEIQKHIKEIPRTWPVSNENDLIQDRGCQISYSLLGHNEELEKKEAFDPDSSKRKKLLEQYPLKSDTVEVKIGGTTCLDYIQHGYHKGFNVAGFINRMDWHRDTCLYIGDALFPGGNDEAVVGVIETKQVKDPADTLTFLKTL